MQCRFTGALACLVAAGLLGCAGTAPPKAAAPVSVDFTWEGVRPCSNVSPRIAVHDYPAATRRLRVELVDLDAVISRHGGGEVALPKDGVIPPGALTNYRGPCPSQKTIKYEMRVWALDASGAVLARGAAERDYTPVTLSRSIRR